MILNTVINELPQSVADSIFSQPEKAKEGLKEIMEAAKENPHEFWHSLLDSLVQFGIKLLVAILIYLIGAWLIRMVKRALKRMFERRKSEPTIASFVISLVTIILTVVLVIIAVGTLGVDTTSVAALLAAGGMAIGMALSGTVQNFAGGIMLLAFKPFKAGDFIEAQGHAGKVIEVNITATKILTTDNRVVILPNGILSNGTINNYSGRPIRRIEWTVSVSYGVEAKACKDAILAIVRGDERVLLETTDMNTLYKELNVSNFQLSMVNYRMDAIPAPFVALKSLNESDITFVVRAWVRSADYWDVFFDLQERFYSELPKQGFTFAYPHIELVR
jgi:small conductance mechanosensitive channel